jgi:hypothetical protein
MDRVDPFQNPVGHTSIAHAARRVIARRADDVMDDTSMSIGHGRTT